MCVQKIRHAEKFESQVKVLFELEKKPTLEST